MNLSNLSPAILKRIHEGIRINPARDWFILLSLSGIALCAIVVWNILTFQTLIDGGVIGSKVTRSAPVFDTASLDVARTIIENRAKEEKKFTNGAYHYSDPSQ